WKVVLVYPVGGEEHPAAAPFGDGVEGTAGDLLADLGEQGLGVALDEAPKRLAPGGLQERLGVHGPGPAGDLDLVEVPGAHAVATEEDRDADDAFVADGGHFDGAAVLHGREQGNNRAFREVDGIDGFARLEQHPFELQR